MKFHVINKVGHYSAEAETLKELATSGFETDPFMVVAAESVAEGEDYQAIQVHPDTVLINSKPGHRYVTAASITEAFESEAQDAEADDGNKDIISVQFETQYGTAPATIELTEAGSVELPTLTYEDEENNYVFNGWKNGKKSVTSPLNVTKDTKLTASWTVTEKPFVPVEYNFTSYAADKTTIYASGTAKTLEKAADGKQKIQVLTNEPEDANNPFIGKVLYVSTTADDNGFYQLYAEDKTELPIFVKLA